MNFMKTVNTTLFSSYLQYFMQISKENGQALLILEFVKDP